MQPADECECRDPHRMRKFGQLALEVAEIGLEAIALPHLNGENMVVVLLGLPARSVWSEERSSYLLEVVKRMLLMGTSNGLVCFSWLGHFILIYFTLLGHFILLF